MDVSTHRYGTMNWLQYQEAGREVDDIDRYERYLAIHRGGRLRILSLQAQGNWTGTKSKKSCEELEFIFILNQMQEEMQWMWRLS